MDTSTALNEMQLMLKDQAEAGESHRPTRFWQAASAKLVQELEECGFEDCRRTSVALSYFVPTYGPPGNCLREDWVQSLLDRASEEFGKDSKSSLTLQKMLTGEEWAKSDYRCYLSGNDRSRGPHLETVSESQTGNPVESFEFDGRRFSRSMLNYLNNLVFLKQNLDASEITSVLEVGGGFGTLGEILYAENGKYTYIDVDIPPTAAVAEYYLNQIHGNKVVSYADTRDLERILVPASGVQMVLCPWQLPKLEGKVDLFVNFASFQEMEPDVVNDYLDQARRLSVDYILLRNLREGKADAKKDPIYGVNNPITTDDYVKFLTDFELIARNVNPFGYHTVDNFHSELLLFRRS